MESVCTWIGLNVLKIVSDYFKTSLIFFKSNTNNKLVIDINNTITYLLLLFKLESRDKSLEQSTYKRSLLINYF